MALWLLLFLVGIVTCHDSSHLYLTAVTSTGRNYAARFQCWRFAKPFKGYPTVGKSMQLADVSNVTYVILPPDSQEGIHHPPHPMLFIQLKGLAHVRLPDGSGDLWIEEGDVIVAVDTEGEGHYTDYPQNTESHALQLPFKDGKVPKHDVVAETPCPKQRSTFHLQLGV